MMTYSRVRVLCSCAVSLLSLAACLPRPVGAQATPKFTMAAVSLRAIATDFEMGRNVIYCYYGMVVSAEPQIHVDSVQVVSSPTECKGVGFGFISRVTDPVMLAAMLRGLIADNPAFRVVSAFYGTELIDLDGQPIRAARALSVMRPTEITRAVFGS